ncbi:MAG: ATP-binding cassette domain-containing protein [Prevotellaceae bacterium]|nr:ATP-binding cassette domain-containing protein [Prevotellaceae bacterium]
MNESLLKTLTQLFALFVVKAQVTQQAAQLVFARFLEDKDLTDEQSEVFLQQFESIYERFRQDNDQLEQLRAETKHLFLHQLSKLADEVNCDNEQRQKIWVVLQLIEFVGDLHIATPDVVEAARHFAVLMRISPVEFNNCMCFMLGNETSMPLNENLLLVSHANPFADSGIRFLENKKLIGKVFVLLIASTNTLLVKYFGKSNFFLNGRNLNVGRSYIFGVGAVIRSPRIDPIYYNKVISTFTQNEEDEGITFVAHDISYRFRGSKDGVHPFSFHARSGELVAIMGGSGVGKSTLLNLLNGHLKLRTGQITINGHDIHADPESVKGAIGYVPQDELLVEELTVYENLYYNALLCFRDYSKEQIEKEITTAVEQFDLVEARNLKVGNPLNKFISGGQRKRLNMALELMRQPSVLFVDEPTSGLSSIDSEKVMLLLKRQSMRGKLVVVNIHQPSSDLFKLFNRVLVMDHGGRVIFQGNPMDAIVYFKEAAHFINPEESECITCGNVNTDLILKIVEARAANEYGRLTRKRRRTAEEWYRRYMKKINPRIWSERPPKSDLPKNDFKIPGRLQQMLVFVRRNIKAKLANRQYMLITLLEAPVLALILGYFTKFIAGTPGNPSEYVFSENANIPSYLFMCVVGAIFFGLSASAQEIIKDRKLLQREKFLNLSRNSYLLSKVLVMLIVSAIQSLSFILVGNSILEIDGLTPQFFAIMFSASVCSNLIGLNISSALNSEVAIYILIPLILVPQLLFSGVVVRFDKLHTALLSTSNVPIVADAMVSRWAYEALAVAQFSDNRYEKRFFDYDMQLSRLAYASGFYLPQLEINAGSVLRNAGSNPELARDRLLLLRNELPAARSMAAPYGIAIPMPDSFGVAAYTPQYAQQLRQSLSALRQAISAQADAASRERSAKVLELEQQLGGQQALVAFKRKYYNNTLAEVVLNQNDFEKIRISGDARLVQVKDPIFREPSSRWGRAHLYAPYKMIGSAKIKTLWFNIGVMWMGTALLYIMLYFDWLRIIVTQADKMATRRIAKRIARIIPR